MRPDRAPRRRGSLVITGAKAGTVLARTSAYSRPAVPCSTSRWQRFRRRAAGTTQGTRTNGYTHTWSPAGFAGDEPPGRDFVELGGTVNAAALHTGFGHRPSRVRRRNRWRRRPAGPRCARRASRSRSPRRRASPPRRRARAVRRPSCCLKKVATSSDHIGTIVVQLARVHRERRDHHVAGGGVEFVVVQLGHTSIVPRHPTAPARASPAAPTQAGTRMPSR